MFNFLTKFFDFNQKEISRLTKKVQEINSLEDKARKLKDSDFPKETEKLKNSIDGDMEKTHKHLPWAYALVREAARRTLNQRHFDVQMIAAVALHEGKIAESKTGEGKTLSATPALYLNALTGHGAHLVTVNDYLARRDAGWMGNVFDFLGLKTAAIISEKSFLFDPDHNDPDAGDRRLSNLKPVSRKEAYEADITYGINSEFGFDYLRDNMAVNKTDLVQREFNYAIIDEADSVLIDEARTPHIISAPKEEDTSKYYDYSKIVSGLKEKEDYIIDEKLKTANLTDAGIGKIESAIGVSNIYEKDFDTLFHIEAALKAKTLFKKDKDYIVKDNEVIIVDEFTGRLLNGRRFSEGLHQAIEAKERVTIQRESKTLATVSLQNYFRMYKKLAGMTGTAATEAEEFNKIYKTDVLSIPTHLSMVRRDEPDMIYKTEKAKFDAVVEEVSVNYKIGRPVLVGTTSIQKNEYLSTLLNRRGIPHELLNAKNHEKEASIISKAGVKGAVTVATNMAGRGVDIILGGEPPDRNQAKEMSKWQAKHDEVVELGGLHVIGTERHESRRIDNQLRGRSGRQGDPGKSTFFVSLEDDLMRIFGGEQISNLMNFLKFPDDQPLTHSMVSRAIEQAQVKVEGFNFDIRKHLVDFDDVLNRQREIIYTLRRKIVNADKEKTSDLYENLREVFREEVANLTNSFFMEKIEIKDEDREKMISELGFLVAPSDKKINELIASGKAGETNEYLMSRVDEEILGREKKFGADLWTQIIKMIFLGAIDKYWMDHLTAIEDLREGINLRGYAQMDPLVEYKNAAYSMFENLVGQINYEVTRRLFRVELEVSKQEKKEEPRVYRSATSVDPFTNKEKPPEAKQIPPPSPTSSVKKPGRNEPCWCGSNKKYKKCHYPN